MSEWRKAKSLDKTTSMITSGTVPIKTWGKMNLSSSTLESVVKNSRVNSPIAKTAATMLAGKNPQRKRKSK